MESNEKVEDQNEGSLMLNVPEYVVEKFVNAEVNMDLLGDDEPVVTKEYKELQPAYEYPMAAQATAGNGDKKDPKRVKEQFILKINHNLMQILVEIRHCQVYITYGY